MIRPRPTASCSGGRARALPPRRSESGGSPPSAKRGSAPLPALVAPGPSPRLWSRALAALAFTGGIALLSSPAPADDAATWRPPAGIPAPSFGLFERPAPPTYVVDASHPLAADEQNPRGTRDRPRKTIPDLSGLLPGDVVEIGPGDYAAGRGVILVNGRGTPERPIFIRGRRPDDRPRILARLEVAGGDGATCVVLEDLVIDGGGVTEPAVEIAASPDAPVERVALRRSEVKRGGGVVVRSRGNGVARDIVIDRDAIHDNGDWRAEYDEDVHGVRIGGASEDIWVLECELYHNSGDGVQINPGRFRASDAVKRIYLGRNLCWENKQTGLWTKQAQDVIVSENVVRDHAPIGKRPSAWGAAMGYQYGPDRVWFLFNRISSCSYGIAGYASESDGLEERVYCIGNVIRRIRHSEAYPYSPHDPWSNAAIMLASGSRRHIVNNTIYDVDGGIHLPQTGEAHVLNNIVAGVRQGSHLALEGPLAAEAEVRGNLFDGEERLRWDGQPAALRLKSTLVSRAGAAGALWLAPLSPVLFVDGGSGDLRLARRSAAIDRGVDAEAYATFRAFYGIDIRVDANGRPRPMGGGYDCGAFERDPGD